MHINKLPVPAPDTKEIDIAGRIAEHFKDIDYVISGRPMHAICNGLQSCNDFVHDHRKPHYVIRVDRKDMEKAARVALNAFYGVAEDVHMPQIADGIYCPTLAVGSDIINIYCGDDHERVCWELRKDLSDYVYNFQGLKIMNPIYMIGKYLVLNMELYKERRDRQIFYNWARNNGYTIDQCKNAVFLAIGQTFDVELAEMEMEYLGKSPV